MNQLVDWGSLNFVNWSSDKTKSSSGAPIPFGAQTPVHCPMLWKTVTLPILPAWIFFPNTIQHFLQPCGCLPVQQDQCRLATTETSSCVALRRFSSSNYWYSLINQNSGVCHKSPSVTQRPVTNLHTDFAVTERHPWFPKSVEGNHCNWKVISEDGVSDHVYGLCQCPMCCTVYGSSPCCKLFSEPCSAVFSDTSSSLALQHQT